MADNEEKVVPEAEEAAKEETAPAAEAKAEEKAPAAEAAAPEAKEEKAKKPANSKLLAICGIAVGGVAVLVFLIFFVIALVSKGSAINAYNEAKKIDPAKKEQQRIEKFEEAYSSAKMAWFMSSSDKNTITVAYIKEVLCKKGSFYEAYKLLESTSLTDDEKDEVYASNGNLAMCKPGNIAVFGEYDTAPVEWLVLDVETKKINGEKHATALLMSKDIIGTPAGWGATTVYGKSDLHDFCDITFKAQFSMSLSGAEQKSVCITNISTPDGDVTAWAFAPSKELIETYLVGDLANYIQASPTQGAKMAGVAGPGTSKFASYYLRDIGKLDGTTQYACGVNHNGEISDGFSMTQRSIGARVCINVDLGLV